LKCPLGTWSSQEASPTPSSCQACPAGRWGEKEGLGSGVECTACLPGTWSQEYGATSSEVCQSCPVGTWSQSSGASSPSVCIECPMGTWNDQSGISSQAECSKCPAGTWSDVRGASEASTCRSCSVGRYQPAVGQSNHSVCLRCPPGTYNMGPGAASCDACPAGSWSDAFGASSCNLCPQSEWTYSTGSMRVGDCTPGALRHASVGASVHMTFQIRHMDDAFLAPSRLGLLESELAKQIALALNVDVRAVVDVAGENATVSIAPDGAVSAYVLGATAPLDQLARTLYDLPFRSRLLQAANAIDPGASAKGMVFAAISIRSEQFVPVVPTTTSTSTVSTTTTSTTSLAGLSAPTATSHDNSWWWVLAALACLVLASGLTCATMAVRARRTGNCGVAETKAEQQREEQREEVVPRSSGPVLLGGHAIAQSSEQKEPKASIAKPVDDADPGQEPSGDSPTLRNAFSSPLETHGHVEDLEQGSAWQGANVHSSMPVTTPRIERDCNVAACSVNCWESA